MKKVLITGANSYVGLHVEEWLMKEPDKFYVETLDMKDPNWKKFDFSKFDVVFHVAGIAHVSEKKKMKNLYFKVNRDLSIETALKAKSSGVKQFIFMSSMIVYSSKDSIINEKTIPNPDNFYGLSKLEAEHGIQKLQDESFKICILRPPMIYGPNSRGNFLKLINFVMIIHFFPNIDNMRSMLYISNLCEFVRYIISNQEKGIFYPQNKEYVSVSNIIDRYSKLKSKKIIISKIFNPLIKIMLHRISILEKVFGNRMYSQSMSYYKQDYCKFDFEHSLRIIGGKDD